MTATRVTWGRALWAVVVATFFAAVVVIAFLIALMLLGVPIPMQDGTSGQGWPWRIEGPWSLAADIGPLLAAGAAFAYFAESITTGHTRVPTRRVPIALAAATLGWVNVHGADDAGVVGVGGLAAFAGLVILTRELSGHPRAAWRWTPRRAWSAVVVVSALVVATLSYGFLHPLTLDNAELQSVKDGVARIHTRLSNEGRAEVTVLSVKVPGVPTRALTDPVDPSLSSFSYESSADDPDRGMVPINGRRVLHGNSRAMELVIPIADCPSSRIVDRVHVRFQVLGRTVEQVVRLKPVPVGCR